MKKWKYKKIGDICVVERGGSPRPIDKFITEDESGINWIKIGDTSDSMYITKTAQKIIPEGVKKSRYVKPGDFLLSNSMSFGRPYILKIDGCIHDGWLVLRDEDEIFDKRFLYYYLSSKATYEKFQSMAVGGVVNNLNSNMIRRVEVPIPDMTEQSNIADLLDKLKKIVDSRKKELTLLDDLIRARFVEMFGNGHDGFCNTKKLGEFCKFQQGTQIPVEEQIEEQLEGYTRFLRIIDYTQAPQIPRYVSVKGREIAEDSVVIVRYGATAGFVGHGYAGILANNLFEVVPDESILSKDFLYLALKYGTFEQEVHDKAFGAAMPALSFGMMNDIGVVTPNSTAQNGFVDFVKQVDKSKLLSGCRLFHSWAPENRDKPKHVGVPQRKTKVLRGGRRQQ